MAFHTFDEPGQNHSRQEVEAKIAQAQETDRWSFVEKEILEQLLALPNCVGIRVYNTFNDETHNRLIVVGVTQEGAEIQRNVDGESAYLTSRIRISANGETEVLQSNNILRSTALVQVRVRRAKPELDFATFFSTEAIRQLLKPETCNGLNFYWINIQHTEKISFPSHLAASARFSENDKKITLSEDGIFISCPLPCPPRCAPEAHEIKQDRNLSARNVSNINSEEEAFERYLISWN